jgi:23S rRNA (uracil1939-C5)-methyltransferase
MKHRRSNTPASRPAKSAVVEIEKPIYGGAFLARMEGKATFVPLTLPGEQARIRIVEDKRSYATAEPDGIISSSSSRVQPLCLHFGACGGCSYQHSDYTSQLAIKQQILSETLQRGGVQPPEKIDVLAGEPWSYRNRIRVAMDASGRVGYRERRSHAILPIAECPIAAPLLVRAALRAAEVLRNSRPAFSAKEISLFCDSRESELLCSVFVSGGASKGFENFVAAWKERVPELAGVECLDAGTGADSSRQIGGWGAKSIRYGANNFQYRVDHGAFFQVNRWLIDSLVDRVVRDQQGKLAWDLFAGVGLFARQLTARFDEVIAVESAPSATEALADNLRETGGRSVSADTLSFLKSRTTATTPDLIVVDPPRAGLGPEVTSLLGNIGSSTLVYVSCDPATLARDLRVLLGNGYAIANVTLADLFPQTFHLETVVTLHRS